MAEQQTPPAHTERVRAVREGRDRKTVELGPDHTIRARPAGEQ